MKSIITSAEATELRRLHGELPNAAAAAREALKTGGKALTGPMLQHLLDADARMFEIIDRIKAILG